MNAETVAACVKTHTGSSQIDGFLSQSEVDMGYALNQKAICN